MRIISGALQSTPIPWLPVLSHPAWRCNIHTVHVTQQSGIQRSSTTFQWHLSSPNTSASIKAFCLGGKSSSRHNCFSVKSWAWRLAVGYGDQLLTGRRSHSPTSRFHLRRRQWSLLNFLRPGQCHCGTCRNKWGLTDNKMCVCGDIRTMSHIVDSWPLNKLDGGLQRLHATLGHTWLAYVIRHIETYKTLHRKQLYSCILLFFNYICHICHLMWGPRMHLLAQRSSSFAW